MAIAKYHESYFGLAPYGVLIDESDTLKSLANVARTYRPLPFEEKFTKIQHLAKEAMKNAWEGQAQGDAECKKIVFNPQSLGYALEKRLGCCRYQSTLFFILAFEAELGDDHYLQSSPLGTNVRTCFNEIIVHERRERRIVSLFLDTLEDIRYDYTQGRPDIFETPVKERCEPFFSYHRYATDHPDRYSIYEIPYSHRGQTADCMKIFEPPHAFERYHFARA